MKGHVGHASEIPLHPLINQGTSVKIILLKTYGPYVLLCFHPLIRLFPVRLPPPISQISGFPSVALCGSAPCFATRTIRKHVVHFAIRKTVSRCTTHGCDCAQCGEPLCSSALCV